jgi:hypothetical protein
MRSILLLVIPLAAAPLAFAACSDGTIITPDDAGSDATTNADSGRDSAPNDGGPGADSASEAAADAAVEGAASDPNKVECGSETCTTPAQVCCTSISLGGITQSCQAPIDGGCGEAGAPQACDEAADCPGGNVCCFTQSGFDVKATCHQGQCPQGAIQLCKKGSECPQGTCTAYDCRIRVVQACEKPNQACN